MPRVKLKFPEQQSLFFTKIPLRISDMNYGNHLGNDKVLSLVHEARVQFLHALGYTEMDIGGCGLIMSDAIVVFKKESFYGDVLYIPIYIGEINAHSFDLFYKLVKKKDGLVVPVAEVKTGMVCFDYITRKVCSLPEAFLKKLSDFEDKNKEAGNNTL